jgi:acetoin utilization protein AcuB
MALPFKKILAPVDFDENSLTALDVAVQLARQSGGRISILHVVAKPVPHGDRERLAAYVDACLAEERERQDKLSKMVRGRMLDVPYEILTRTGDPAIAILDTQAELGADVVVIATHSRKPGPHPFTGSVAERVVRESACPVLTVRADAFADSELVGAQMTPNPVTAGPEESLAGVQERMRAGGFRRVPVLDAGLLVGIVTDRDVRTHLSELEETRVRTVMTTDVVTVAPATSIREAGRLMLECEVGGLPVVEDRKLVGMITTADILKAFVC